MTGTEMVECSAWPRSYSAEWNFTVIYPHNRTNFAETLLKQEYIPHSALFISNRNTQYLPENVGNPWRENPTPSLNGQELQSHFYKEIDPQTLILQASRFISCQQIFL